MMNNETNETISRRRAIASTAALAGAFAFVRNDVAAAQTTQPHDAHQHPQQAGAPDQSPGEPGRDYTPVIVPNGWTLPYKIIYGVKVFHLVATEVYHEFAAGLRAHCWGYNGSVHGPVIEAVEGDRVRIFVTNQISAPTTVHWHGLLIPSGMDGVGGLNQKAIHTGETFMYEFTLRQHGTYMYHSHHDEMTQIGMGMVGMFIIHPRGVPAAERPTRDFAIMLHEWAIDAGAERPDPNEMTDFNVLTMNAKAFPGTAPLVAKVGDRVRIRLGNLGPMDHHPIHLHGYYFHVVATDGGTIAESARRPETTVLVAVGQTRTIEFVADNPGDWAMHCHMTHHVMNQMGHEFPNMIGVKPGEFDRSVRDLLPGYMTMGQDGMGDMGTMGMKMPPNSIPMVGGEGPHDYITMGGMFTLLKVRESLPNGYDADPGWYNERPEQVASLAAADVLQRNAIAADGSSAPKPPFPTLTPNSTTKPTQEHLSHGGHGRHGERAAQPTTRNIPATLYVCPMHPEVTSEKPGECPKCGMDLKIPK